MLVFKLSCFVVGLLGTFAQTNFDLEGFDIEVGCPKSWIFSDNACYYFGEGKLSRDAASAKCEAIGGQLFEPDGDKDNIFVKDTLTQMNSNKASTAWIYDYYSSTLNGWVPGSGFRGGFEDWAKNPAPEGDGLCMVMSKQFDWRWDAQDCYNEQDMLYVCETEPVMVDCYAESCYTLMHNNNGQNDSCQSDLGYYPARVESSEENDFIKNFLKDAIYMYDMYHNTYYDHPMEGKYNLVNGGYVGGSDADTEATWKYDNDDKVKYTDWVSGENPAAASAGDDCIVLDAAYDYKWQDIECGNPKYVQVCEEENPENPGQSWWWG